MKPCNIVVLVVDCGRAVDFPSGANPVGGLPAMEKLARESLVFPNGLTPSPWTIPAHASIFTGLYPWEHGLHGKGLSRIPSGTESIASILGRKGYRTISLSANPFISPATGLTDGFETAAWGNWLDTWTRFRRFKTPPHSVGLPAQAEGAAARLVYGGLHELFQRSERHLLRHPFLWQTSSEALSRVFASSGENRFTTGWIEETLRAWISRIPDSEPAFCFINLLDAHEPYQATLTGDIHLGEWYRKATVPQDPYSMLNGTWNPGEPEFRILHELYRATLRAVDVRVSSLVKILSEAGRWEDTTFLMTADHGQSLGESGALFHTLRLDEAMLRIPLWVKFPNSRFAGERSPGTVSLIDILPTVTRLVWRWVPDDLPGIPVDDLRNEQRASPLFAFADGLVQERARNLSRVLSPERLIELDHPMVAGYDDRYKVVIDLVTRAMTAFDLAADPSGQTRVPPEGLQELSDLVRATSECANVVRGRIELLRDSGSSTSFEKLRSWGYV